MKKIVFVFSSSLLVIFVIIAILNFSNSDKFYLSDLLSYLNSFPQNAYYSFIQIFLSSHRQCDNGVHGCLLLQLPCNSLPNRR